MDKKFITYFVLGIFGFSVIGFLIGHFATYKFSDQNYEPLDMSGGTYVRLVYIGSSNCYFSNARETINSVNYIKRDLKKLLNEHNINFLATGISVDISSDIAIEHIEKTGPYNEILVGNGPFNLGTIHYASGASPTPKIILFLEEYKTNLVGLKMDNLTKSQELIANYSGQYEIEDLKEYIETSSDSNILNFLNVSR